MRCRAQRRIRRQIQVGLHRRTRDFSQPYALGVTIRRYAVSLSNVLGNGMPESRCLQPRRRERARIGDVGACPKTGRSTTVAGDEGG